MATETSTPSRMATPLVAKRFSAKAIDTAAILRAAGVVPDLAVLQTLKTIDQRNPGLPFHDFAAACLLAWTMAEAPAMGGHS